MGEKRGNYNTELMERLDYNTLCRLVTEGKTDEEIAKMYYVHRSTIYRIRKEWGIHKPRNPEKYDWGMVKRMLESNLTYVDIAYIYQVSERSIINYVSRKRKGERAHA